MHSPETQAFQICWPWYRRNTLDPSIKMWTPFITIWHVDPCKGPACGWFMRHYHGDKKVLGRIIKRFEFDWDRTWTSEKSTYLCGLFCPNGDPHYSTHGIVLQMFFMAAVEVFGSDGRTNWKRAKKFLDKNLLDILLFAENPTDSLFDGITRKFEIGCGEAYTKERRDERLRHMAQCVYGWILRAERPWYKHPRWHFWHWKLQVHPWQTFLRWAFTRCATCGKRFKWGESGWTNQWDHEGPRFFKGERDMHHNECGRSPLTAKTESK